MEENEAGSIVTLVDEDGKDVQFDLLMTFDYEKKRYAALLPIDRVEGVDDDEVLLLEIVHEGENEIYRPIENPVLLEEVFNEFSELFDEEIAENDGEE